METTGDKFTIQYCSQPATPTGKKAVYATQKVREKDFVVLSEDKASSIDAVLAEKADDFANAVKEAWELLLSDEATASEEISFADVAAYALSELKADMSWAFYSALKNTFYFEEIAPLVFKPRSESAIDELVKKAESKGKEEELRAAFIERLKKRQLDLPADSKYMVDVEALALGKSDHSKTLHDAKITETPENAHKILLDTKIWDITRNPYPVRWGLSMQSATEGLDSPPDEGRMVVEGTSYAIDNAWSTDPDDAVAFDGTYLWVHIADPASTVRPDDKIDRIARGRGATLYIPEGASRMLSEDCLEDYALGLSEKSRALSFRILLDEKNAVADCQVFKTWVTVARL
ncbi:MAG: RNB domain-containing ribonuclease, partial [Spirochaetaceae bacterium]|nr:RNB domain-containing ribonuclease [Spirochaetaceae bacterium]